MNKENLLKPNFTIDSWYNDYKYHFSWAGLIKKVWTGRDLITGKSTYIMEYIHPAFKSFLINKPAEGESWQEVILSSKEDYLLFVSKWKALWKVVATQARNLRTNRRILKAAGAFKTKNNQGVDFGKLPLKSLDFEMSTEIHNLTLAAKALIILRVNMKKLSYEAKQKQLLAKKNFLQ